MAKLTDRHRELLKLIDGRTNVLELESKSGIPKRSVKRFLAQFLSAGYATKQRNADGTFYTLTELGESVLGSRFRKGLILDKGANSTLTLGVEESAISTLSTISTSTVEESATDKTISTSTTSKIGSSMSLTHSLGKEIENTQHTLNNRALAPSREHWTVALERIRNNSKP
jgi:flagellar biogenesis protein FliO